jgi:hypothetical protein
MKLTEDTLTVLSCRLDLRPQGTPHLGDLVPSIQRLWREDQSLVVAFDPAALDTVSAFAASERLCCSEIGWEVESEPELRLRITATSNQLDLLEQGFQSLGS